MQHQYTIRLETPKDYRRVEEITREAFWNEHAPGADEHYLAHIMRDVPGFIKELDFVAEHDGELVGSIMYTQAWVEDAQGIRHDVILFGPLSVLPQWQRKGVGRALITHSAAAAKEMGHKAVVIYGDPLYYGRFGFQPASRFGITPPDGQPHPALQVLLLEDGALDQVSGRFHEDPVYETLSKEAVETFDGTFPPKEKKVTESQRRFFALSGNGTTA